MRQSILIIALLLCAGDVLAQAYNVPFRRRAAAGGGYPSELVAYWEMNETSGTRVDAHGTGCGGSGCDLTDNNTVTSVSGVVGNAASFDDANSEYLSHADDDDLDLGGDIDFTITWWVYRDDQGAHVRAFEKGNEYAVRLLNSGLNGDAQGYVYNGGACGFNSDAMSNATWYFVVFSYDDTAGEAYLSIDDGTDTSKSCTSTINTGTSSLTIGGLAASAYLDGAIDEMAIFKGVKLGTVYQTCMYNSGSGRSYADLSTCGTDAGT